MVEGWFGTVLFRHFGQGEGSGDDPSLKPVAFPEPHCSSANVQCDGGAEQEKRPVPTRSTRNIRG